MVFIFRCWCRIMSHTRRIWRIFRPQNVFKGIAVSRRLGSAHLAARAAAAAAPWTGLWALVIQRRHSALRRSLSQAGGYSTPRLCLSTLSNMLGLRPGVAHPHMFWWPRRDLVQPDVIWSSPTWSGPARRDLVQPDVIGPASPTFSTWLLLDLTWVDKWGWAVHQFGGEQPNWELLKLTYLWFLNIEHYWKLILLFLCSSWFLWRLTIEQFLSLCWWPAISDQQSCSHSFLTVLYSLFVCLFTLRLRGRRCTQFWPATIYKSQLSWSTVLSIVATVTDLVTDFPKHVWIYYDLISVPSTTTSVISFCVFGEAIHVAALPEPIWRFSTLNLCCCGLIEP